MKIQYASDLHLEFPENKAFLGTRPLEPQADVLVLAGDIVPFAAIGEHRDFFDFLSDHFRITYWLPGNHEYYHGDVAQRSGAFTTEIRKNVLLLNNSRVSDGGITMLFTTLWTRISAANAWQVERGMSDFRLIRKNGLPFTSVDYNELHLASLRFLEKELTREDNSPTVVVTHHVPTLTNYPARFSGSVLNEAFAVNLDALIRAYGPSYWIFGHHHQPVEPFTIGSTTLLNNQLGYVQMDEHYHFRRGCVLDVSQ